MLESRYFTKCSWQIKIGWEGGQPLIQAFPPLGEEEHSMTALTETMTRLNQYGYPDYLVAMRN
ncbi:hypothetical protein HALO98_50477 [Vreelandella titanicae]|nr:hypothetical protein HALO98_50477 [Halomonas titanicae]